MPIIDTSVIIEMINAAGNFHLQAETIRKQLDLGKITAHVPKPNLSEIYYVALRIFSQLKKDPQNAKDLISWMTTHKNFTIHSLSMNLIFLSGEIKNKFSIYIMDSFNFALAKSLNEQLIFKIRESEFTDDLLKEFNIIFLDQF